MSAIDPAVAAQIDAAFDYRGHVTVTLKDGKVIEGYIYHRNLDERFGEPSAVIRAVIGSELLACDHAGAAVDGDR